MDKRWLALSLALPLAGCITAAESDAITKAYADCIWDVVVRMDDGKTDPVSLAYGIAPQCAVEYRRVTEVLLNRMITQSGQIAAEQTMKDQELRGVTSAILIHRSKQAKQ